VSRQHRTVGSADTTFTKHAKSDTLFSFTEKIAELYQFIYGDLTTMGNGSGDNLASIRLNRYPVAPAAEPTPC